MFRFPARILVIASTACLMSTLASAALVVDDSSGRLGLGSLALVTGESRFSSAASTLNLDPSAARSGLLPSFEQRQLPLPLTLPDWSGSGTVLSSVSPLSPWSSQVESVVDDGRKQALAVSVGNFQLGLWSLFSRSTATASNRNLFSVLGVQFTTLRFEQEIPPPVPLPPSAWLFLTALLGFGAWQWQRGRTAQAAVPQFA